MEPVVAVAIPWVLFVGSHLVLALDPVRRRGVAWLGERGFMVAYSLVAWVALGAGLFAYDRHRFEGPPGLDLPWLTGPAVVCIVLGTCLVFSIMSPRGYVASPMALFASGTAEPQGLDRVTRHPMFAGVALLSLGHVMVAHSLVGVVTFGSLTLLGVLGCWHQDTKLRARHGDGYQRYLDQTSAVPFLAIARGRQRLVLGELPWVFLGMGLAGAWTLRALHGMDVPYRPHALLAALIMGPIFLTGWAWSRNRRTE